MKENGLYVCTETQSCYNVCFFRGQRTIWTHSNHFEHFAEKKKKAYACKLLNKTFKQQWYRMKLF